MDSGLPAFLRSPQTHGSNCRPTQTPGSSTAATNTAPVSRDCVRGGEGKPENSYTLTFSAQCDCKGSANLCTSYRSGSKPAPQTKPSVSFIAAYTFTTYLLIGNS